MLGDSVTLFIDTVHEHKSRRTSSNQSMFSMTLECIAPYCPLSNIMIVQLTSELTTRHQKHIRGLSSPVPDPLAQTDTVGLRHVVLAEVFFIIILHF